MDPKLLAEIKRVLQAIVEESGDLPGATPYYYSGSETKEDRKCVTIKNGTVKAAANILAKLGA